MDIDYALNNFDREVQRRQAESSLATSYKLLKTIIDTAPVRIFWKYKELRKSDRLLGNFYHEDTKKYKTSCFRGAFCDLCNIGR